VPEISAERALDCHFTDTVRALMAAVPTGAIDLTAPVAPGSRLTGRQAIAVFDAQAGSRHLDLAARYLRADGHGFYTIG
jgi:2-oxoisovalerate dehydrogenase E1 component